MPTPFDALFAPTNPLTASALPAFGGSAPSMPPFATPPFVPPSAPITLPPLQTERPQASSPDFVQAALPIVAALLAGGRDPRAIGEGLAAFQKGRSLKRAEQERTEDRAHRESQERAQFYGRALDTLNSIDDPLQFEQTLDALGPMLDLHQIQRGVFVFSDAKKQAKAKKEAQATIDQVRKIHGEDVDNPEWRAQFTIDGTSLEDLYRLAQMPTVRNAQGAAVAPNRSAFKANTTAEMRLAAYAKTLGKRVEDLTVEELDAANGSDETGGASDFDRHLQRHYAAVKARLGRDSTPDEKVKEELVAKKAYNQSDDKPTDPVLLEIRALTAANLRNAKLTPAQETAARGLADDFTRDTKDYQIRLDSLLTMREIMKAPSAAGDIALVFAFMKLQDPNSAVRETEYANAQNAAGVPERIRNMYNKLIDGEFLTEGQRRDFMAQSQSIFRAARSKYDITRRSYEQRAKARNIDPSLVITDYDALLADGDSPAAPPPAGGPKVGDTKTFPNGKKGRWDGTGYELVP